MSKVLICIIFMSFFYAQSDDWPLQHHDRQSTGISQDVLAEKLEEKWTYEADDSVKSSAAIVGSNVFIATISGKVLCLELTSGKEKWSFSTESAFSASPSVINSVVYIGDEDGSLYALEASSGKKLWSFMCEDKILSGVTYHQDKILFGSYDHHLYCLLAKDGTLQWKVETDAPVHGTPCIIEANVVIAGCDGLVRFIDINTGKENSNFDGKSYFAASPTYSKNCVAIGSLNGDYYCISYPEMTAKWTIAKKANKGECYGSAIITEKQVIFPSKKRRIFAVGIDDGKQIWQYKTRSRIETSPILIGQRIIFSEFSGKIHAIDQKDGKHLWTFETGSRIYASPVVGQGYLVIGCDDGTVYALAAP